IPIRHELLNFGPRTSNIRPTSSLENSLIFIAIGFCAFSGRRYINNNLYAPLLVPITFVSALSMSPSGTDRVPENKVRYDNSPSEYWIRIVPTHNMAKKKAAPVSRVSLQSPPG